ncbi:MAG: acetolactate synthase [Acidimicrobiales bacterium]|nr:acetolactate synthase [Acidimicrobiales bacterium]
MSEPIEGHGGELALAPLLAAGVTELYTLSGGHIFPLLDAAVKAEVRIVDVRHEQTAAFAAEGTAKLTRRPGVAALTAGPGVTNGMSALATARFNGSPVVVLGGRAPQARWGAGSLQEIDHIPFVAPLAKLARTVTATDEIAGAVAAAAAEALTPHRGPVFLDVPLDVLFASGKGDGGPPVPPPPLEPDPDAVRDAAEVLARAERPAIVAGSDVWWGRAEEALVRCAEATQVPVFMNGMGRGCVPADHELAFNRTRGLLKEEADAIVVVGAPLDFRLRFGRYEKAEVVHVVDAPEQRAAHAEVAVSVVGDLSAVLDALAEGGRPRVDRSTWIERLRAEEADARSADADLLGAPGTPIHPARIYGEVLRRLDRDAVVVCDGGDFASYAGRFVDVRVAGSWLDTGPYGCLGSGPGHAIAARVVHPDRQVVLLLGDGAFGFSGMDFDTMVRHRLPVVAVVGNNGIWGLEKHPMDALYGYDVAADLQPGCRYDEVVRALGGAGELVEEPEALGPALDRAFQVSERDRLPYLVNVVTDPSNAYPRTSNLG